jgi:hypothetical protein
MTTFMYNIKENEIGYYRAEILDQIGTAVSILFEGEGSIGVQRIYADLNRLLPGVYYFRIANLKESYMVPFSIMK